jgi:hypothetical protein
MKEREQNSGGLGCFILGMVAFILLPLYVLSVGPVAWLVGQNPGLQWIGVIYFPIGLLASVCPPVDGALQWYIQFWQ